MHACVNVHIFCQVCVWFYGDDNWFCWISFGLKWIECKMIYIWLPFKQK